MSEGQLMNAVTKLMSDFLMLSGENTCLSMAFPSALFRGD